ncbi:MAG: tetraacyldisaccharide 4'-kinase [Pirellulaceae bacterium]
MFNLVKWQGVLSGSDRSAKGWLLRGLLTIASWPYGWVIRFRNWQFDRSWKKNSRCGLPVISIGNLTTGGTGKTPLVIWFAEQIRAQGIRVAILSRGYGAVGEGENDEARELAERLPDVPNLIDPSRVRSARLAREELEMQVCILDDGFQHRYLARDLDVVLIDATLPFGFGAMLPRGLLREPVKGLRRANLVVITRTNVVTDDVLTGIEQTIRKWNPVVPVARSIVEPRSWRRADGERKKIDELLLDKVFMLCAIGNPSGFRASINQLRANVVGEAIFPDHHHFNNADLAQIETRAKEAGAQIIVCTVKDLVKINRNRLGDCPIWALEISSRFVSDEDTVITLLQRVLAAIPPDD